MDIQNQKFVDAVEYFGKDAFKEQSKEDFIKFLNNVQQAVGPLKSYEFIEASTIAIEGTKQGGEYQLKYKVEYEHEKTTEKFFMIQEKGEIKIMGYRIESDSIEIKMKQLIQ